MHTFAILSTLPFSPLAAAAPTAAVRPHCEEPVTRQPSISVIIPTRDRAGLLPRCLNSVFAQSLAPLEIIVIDDGSTDETRSLLARNYPQVRLLEGPGRGVSAARNTGIRAAAGDWLALLDSDDSWFPRKLERQAAALADNPGHRVAHTDEIWIRNGARVNPKLKHKKYGGWIFQRCLPLCVISPSSVMVHRQVFEQVGMFDENLPVCEDYDLWLRICARMPVLFIPEPLVTKYGGHADQLSRRYRGMDRYRILALDKVLNKANLSPADRRAAVDMLLSKAAIYLAGARKHGNRAFVPECAAMLARYGGSPRGGGGQAAADRTSRSASRPAPDPAPDPTPG